MKLNNVKSQKSDFAIHIYDDIKKINDKYFSEDEIKHIKKLNKEKKTIINLSIMNSYKYVFILSDSTSKKELWWRKEDFRKAGSDLYNISNSTSSKNVDLIAEDVSSELAYSFVEGFILSSYRFNRYLTNKENNSNKVDNLNIISSLTKKDLDELSIIIENVFFARDLVNTPVQDMTSEILADNFKSRASKIKNVKIKVLKKKDIEKEGMGGLLAVNRGSIDPPTFSILEYKHPKAKNKKPIVLVGKGVVYDTGGLSLKPTPDSMDYMKSDMGGSAVVSSTFFAIAQAELPLHVVTLVPSTDNRPGGNAYTPGDVITMYSGQTVEVLNTDAEGRMILADALHYAKRYKPEMVVDAATLTGAAAVAFGKYGLVAMGNVKSEAIAKLKESGFDTFERVCEMPFWDDYSELLKSEIADMKNVGGREAGAITAGKFLEKFTDYPYLHLDIAGPTFSKKPDSYRLIGASGFGVRLLFNYFKNY